MAGEWFYRVGSQTVGPISAAALKDLVISGVLLPESLVSKKGDGRWVVARRVKGLPFPTSMLGDAAPSVSSAAPAKDDVQTAIASTTQDELTTAREIARELATATKPGTTAASRKRRFVLGISGAVVSSVVAICAVAFWPSEAPMTPIEQDDSALLRELGNLKNELAKVKQQQQKANVRTDEIRETEIAAAPPKSTHAPAAELNGTSLPPRLSPNEVPSQPIAPSASATPSPASAPEVIVAVRKALVYLETISSSGDALASGSGFVADKAGLIVTNHHVVDGAAKVTITFSDRRQAQVSEWVAASVGTDLVALRVGGNGSKLESIDLADALPQPGADVLAIGAPLGQRETVTKGIVSAIRKGSTAIASNHPTVLQAA